jgi:hypothetical protein
MALITFVSKTKAAAADVNTNFQKILGLQVVNEDLTSVSTDVTVFTAHRFKPGTLRVYLDGVRLRPGAGYEYIENLAGDGFTLRSTPAVPTPLLVDYQMSSLDV